MRIVIPLALIASIIAMSGALAAQTGGPPQVLETVFPHETVPADGSRNAGKVVFQDLEGDVKWADFRVEAPDPQALTISGHIPEDGVVRLEVRAPFDRQRQGQGIVLFKVAATAPQHVTVRVVLVDEAGNTSDPDDPEASFSFTVRGPQPDLVVSLDKLPDLIQIGQTLETTYTVQNLGGSDSGPFRAGVYLSGDDKIAPEDLLVDSKEIDSLAPDVSTTERLQVKLTQDLMDRGGLEPGLLFLGVMVDDSNQVEESDETNNRASRAIQVEVPPKQPAFFKIVSLSVAPTNPVAGSTLTIKAIVENTGEEKSTKPVELYIDGVRQQGFDLALNAGQRWTVSFSYTLPSTEAPRGIVIRVKSPNSEQTLSVAITEASYTVGPSGCPFTKIQAAIDAAKSGDTITVAPGTYQNLTIAKNLTLDGAGKAIISGNGKSPAISISQARNVTIKGFTINNDDKDVGIGVYDGAAATITGNTFTGCLHAVDVWSATSTIDHNTIRDNIEVGILIIASSEAEITQNTITDTKLYEELAGDGIEVMDDSKATITSNTITGNARYGIMVPSWGYGIDNPRSSTLDIRDNDISNNKDAGVALFDHAQATLLGNAIKANTGEGIEVSRDSQVEISNNFIQDTKATADGEWGDGIEVYGNAKATIQGNTITGNARIGIGLWDQARAEIINNTIRNNKDCGVYAEHSSNITSCRGNRVSGNKEGDYCGTAGQKCH
jgi:parallel beta-helix repeat protein